MSPSCRTYNGLAIYLAHPLQTPLLSSHPHPNRLLCWYCVPSYSYASQRRDSYFSERISIFLAPGNAGAAIPTRNRVILELCHEHFSYSEKPREWTSRAPSRISRSKEYSHLSISADIDDYYDEENNSNRSPSSSRKRSSITKLTSQISDPHTMSSRFAQSSLLTSPPAKPSISPTITISSACHTSSTHAVSTRKKSKVFKQRKILKALDHVASNFSPGVFNLLTTFV